MFFFCNLHSTLEEVATTTEKIFDFQTDVVVFMVNDDPELSIQFNFDAPVGSPGTFTLKKNESTGSFPKTARKLHVKALGGNAAFRAMGVGR